MKFISAQFELVLPDKITHKLLQLRSPDPWDLSAKTPDFFQDKVYLE